MWLILTARSKDFMFRAVESPAEQSEGEQRRRRRRKLRFFCPYCLISYAEMGDRCSGCGYSAQACLKRFDYAAPAMSGLQAFREGSLVGDFFGKRSHSILGKLETIFPEVGVYVVVASLGDGVECREFAFWLFNAAPFGEGDSAIKRQGGVMLLIDTKGGKATVVTGYGIEPYLNPDRVAVNLEKLKKNLRKGSIDKAVENWLLLLLRHLRDAHAKSKKLQGGEF